MDPLEAIDWSATLPADMPDRAAIESTIHQIFAHITTERKRILARRSEAERRWLEYVPEQGERVRVLESCNADEERLNGRERQVLAFYKRNFERQRGDAVGHETTAAMQNLSVDTVKPTLSLKAPSSAGSDLTPISPFLQYLLNNRANTTTSTSSDDGPTPSGAKDRTSMTDPIFSPSDFSQQSKTKQQVVATPLSNHAASHPVREVMDDGALDRLRGRLGAKINMLDRVLSTEEQQEVSAAQLAPLTTKASAIDFDAATIRPSPSNKRKTISPVKEHHDTVSIATRGATESAHAAIDPKQPKSLAPGWSIKILESGSGQTSAQADYKTMFVHRDATAVEVLVMALKKWRYLSPQIMAEIQGPRLIVSDPLREAIEREGWQLLFAPMQHQQSSAVQVLKGDQLLMDIIPQDLSTEVKPQFIFCKNADALLKESNGHAGAGTSTDGTDHSFAAGPRFTPVYLYKLDSAFTVPAMHTAPFDVELGHWTRRYVMAAKSRYLLFFKSEHHTAWAQNILHEVDAARILAVEPSDLRVIKKDPAGESIVAAPFTIVLRTRTRGIQLSFEKEPELKLFMDQLDAIRRYHHARTIGEGKPPLVNEPSFRDLAASTSFQENPLQSVVERLAASRKINDVDGMRTSDTVHACRTILQTLKGHAITKLVPLLTASESKAISVEELMPLFRDGLMDDANKLGGSKSSSASTVVSSMKRLFRGIAGGSSNSNPSSVHNSGSSLAHSTGVLNEIREDGTTTSTSVMFGVNLEDLSSRYDVRESGVPVVAPIITHTVRHLLEHALETSGLFRIAGNVKRMEALRKQWDDASSAATADAVKVDFSGFNHHDVAVTDNLATVEEKVRALRYLIAMLSPSHRHTLEALLRFLHTVAKHATDGKTVDGRAFTGNLMNASNLAVCMAPNILREASNNAGSFMSLGAASGGSSSLGNLPAAGMPEQTGDKSRPSIAGKRISSTGIKLTGGAGSVPGSSASSAEQVADSAAVVNVVALMVEHVVDLFTLDEGMLAELQKLAAAPARQI